MLVLAPPAAEAETRDSRFLIADDGTVTVFTGKVELGQGARTEITQAVAEEMRIPVARVRVVMADTALVPDDGMTAGSGTTPRTVPAIRKAAAAARQLLAKTQAGTKITPPAEWKVLGTTLKRVNGRDVVTGALKYSRDLGADQKPLLHGKIRRAPSYRATLSAVDSSAVSKMAGVKFVRDGNFLGVVAPDAFTAERAAMALKPEWAAEPLPDENELNKLFKEKAGQGGGRSRGAGQTSHGDVAAGMASAKLRHEGSYSLAYIAHTPMEPRSAVAEWNGDKLTVYCGSSGPFQVRRQLAEAFHIPESSVHVIVSDTGGSFGGKHAGECQIEAARLAREAGAAVKLQWTREDEFTCAYARPAGLMEVRSGVNAEGKIVAWEFHNYNSGGAAIQPPYEIPNVSCAYHASESPLKQGSYRSLAAVANAFARETHIDELAVLQKLDPLEFRLRNSTNPRLAVVLQRAAERFGWGKKKSGSGAGFGIACNIDKGSLVASCIEVETGGKEPRVRRIVTAFDCGAVLNPDNLQNQITGAAIMGLGGAMFEQLRFDRQRIVNGRLSRYRLPRFSDVPEIEAVVVGGRDVPSAGAGETPITAIAPAIGAAIFAATGERKRRLPLLG
jgi:isoquinoline 1-oxidoreductase